MHELPISDGRYNGIEGPKLEFKPAMKGIPSSTWDTYSSFANADGGRIILGIDDVTKIVEGVSKPEAKIQDLWNGLNNPQVVNENILRQDDIWTYETDGKTLIIMDVPRAERSLRPIYHSRLETGTFKRNGEGDYRCRMSDISAMMRDKSDETYDSKVLPGTLFDDMDISTLHDFRNMLRSANPMHSWNKADDQQFAEMIGALDRVDGCLTVAGLLMFGKEHRIYREFPDFKLDYKELSDNDTEWKYRIVTGEGRWTGNVFTFFNLMYERLSTSIENPLRIGSDMKRIEDTDAHKAIRECVLNAIIHADYRGDLTVSVKRYRDRIEVSNSGLFRISVNEAELGGESDPRNKTIAKMFAMLGLVERAGIGVHYIMDVWRSEFGSKPMIMEDQCKQRVTVRLMTVPVKSMDTVDRHILELMVDDPKISIERIAKSLDVSTATVSVRIKALKASGMVTRIGGTKGRWNVSSDFFSEASGTIYIDIGTMVGDQGRRK